MQTPPPMRRRAVLVVPGSDEHKMVKALGSGADEVVIDLEDAVAVDAKTQARTLVAQVLRSTGRSGDRTIAVRINALDTDWAQDDLAVLREVQGIDSFVVPKVQARRELLQAEKYLHGHAATLQALIETPRGLQTLDDICASTPRLTALVIGYADLGALIGRAPELPPHRWQAIQDRVLLAARAADVQAIDGPHLGIADNGDFRSRVQWAREAGFDGKWVLHPAQIDCVNKEFTPDAAAVADARRVVAVLDEAARSGRGVVRIGDRMLDEAVAVAARRVLAQSEGA